MSHSYLLASHNLSVLRGEARCVLSLSHGVSGDTHHGGMDRCLSTFRSFYVSLFFIIFLSSAASVIILFFFSSPCLSHSKSLGCTP